MSKPPVIEENLASDEENYISEDGESPQEEDNEEDMIRGMAGNMGLIKTSRPSPKTVISPCTRRRTI